VNRLWGACLRDISQETPSANRERVRPPADGPPSELLPLVVCIVLCKLALSGAYEAVITIIILSILSVIVYTLIIWRRRRHLRPRHDTILLDALEESTNRHKRDIRASAPHNCLEKSYGDRPFTTFMSTLTARWPEPEEMALVRPVLGGVLLACGQRVSPKLYSIDTPSINAVIFGGGSSGVHIALTTGMLKCLDRSGIEAVLTNLLARSPHLHGTTLDSMRRLGPSSYEVSPNDIFLWDRKRVIEGDSDAYDADVATTQYLRDPVVILKVLFKVQAVGAAIPGAEIEMLHPGHFFSSPLSGAPAQDQIRKRIERLHRMLEVKERHSEHLR